MSNMLKSRTKMGVVLIVISSSTAGIVGGLCGVLYGVTAGVFLVGVGFLIVNKICDD